MQFIKQSTYLFKKINYFIKCLKIAIKCEIEITKINKTKVLKKTISFSIHIEVLIGT
jgi:hypothetical protein